MSLHGGILSGLGGGGLFGGRGVSLGSANIEGGLPIPAGFSGNAGRKELIRADFYTSEQIMSANNATVFEQLGAVTVLAQQAFRWGFGIPNAPDNQGLVKADLEDNLDTDTEGFIRLVWKDANSFNTHVIKEFRTEILRGSNVIRNEQVLLPEQPIRGLQGRDFAAEDELLALDVKMDTASVRINASTTTIIITATQYFR